MSDARLQESAAAAEPNRAARLDERLALRPREAAAALGLSERTFRSLLPSIPHVRLEGAVLVPVDSLRRWLTDRAKAPGTREDRIVSEILGEIGEGRQKQLTYQGSSCIIGIVAAKKRTWGGHRKGAGRPRLIEDRADRTIRFERPDLEALEEIATDHGVTAADLVREAVRSYIARHRRKTS